MGQKRIMEISHFKCLIWMTLAVLTFHDASELDTFLVLRFLPNTSPTHTPVPQSLRQGHTLQFYKVSRQPAYSNAKYWHNWHKLAQFVVGPWY